MEERDFPSQSKFKRFAYIFKRYPDSNEDRIRNVYLPLYNSESFLQLTKKLDSKDCLLVYDSFSKINTKIADFSKKFIIQKAIAIYFKLLENNKKPFHSEKSFLPFQKSTFPEEAPSIKSLPKSRYFPLFNVISLSVDEDTLFFDSKFESGNLRRVYRISPTEYNLLLEFDLSTENYSQWYFFRVFNIKKDLSIKLNIINLIKPNNFYNEGQQPRVFSEIKASWSDDQCHSITYSKSDWKKLIGKTKLPYYTLSFTYNFGFSNDCTYFAHCFPYTYSDLVIYLKNLEKNWKNVENGIPHRERSFPKNVEPPFFKLFKLTQTIISNDIFVLELGNPKKPKIVLTSRIHPGETNGSLLIKGIIDSLTEVHKNCNNYEGEVGSRKHSFHQYTHEHEFHQHYVGGKEGETQNTNIFGPNHFIGKEGETQKMNFFGPNHVVGKEGLNINFFGANHGVGKEGTNHNNFGGENENFMNNQYSEKERNLFDDFSFAIIPMLNPDGVRYGNYRCGLGGWDMNRRWNGEEGEVLVFVKDYIRKLKENEGVAFFCDIHGHSKSKDVFLYGCNVKDGNEEGEERNLNIRAFPFILSKVKDYFNFPKCSFNMSKCKFGTARITLFNELAIDNCYTLEASLFGCERVGNQHFTIKEYEEIGHNFVLGLHIFFMEKEIKKQAMHILNFKKKKIDCIILESETTKKIKGLELRKKNSFASENKIFFKKIENKIEILPKISKKLERRNNYSSLSNLNMHEKKIDFPLKISNLFNEETFLKNKLLKKLDIKFKQPKKKNILELNKEDYGKKNNEERHKTFLVMVPN